MLLVRHANLSRAHVVACAGPLLVLLVVGAFILNPAFSPAPTSVLLPDNSSDWVVPHTLKHVFVGITFHFNRQKLVFLKYVSDARGIRLFLSNACCSSHPHLWATPA